VYGGLSVNRGLGGSLERRRSPSLSQPEASGRGGQAAAHPRRRVQPSDATVAGPGRSLQRYADLIDKAVCSFQACHGWKYHFIGTLKELGDAESWAGTIEKDVKTVATALEYVAKAERDASVVEAAEEVAAANFAQDNSASKS
jgi:hypothetical protein